VACRVGHYQNIGNVDRGPPKTHCFR
jgi:hypothetical protein